MKVDVVVLLVVLVEVVRVVVGDVIEGAAVGLTHAMQLIQEVVAGASVATPVGHAFPGWAHVVAPFGAGNTSEMSGLESLRTPQKISVPR